MSKPIADLHCHPSLKPHLNQDKLTSIWKYGENPTVRDLYNNFSVRKWILKGVINKMADNTQSNLDSCFAGNNRLLFCSIYPFERPFLKPDRPFKRAGLIIRWVLQLLLKRRYNKLKDNKLIRLITGVSKDSADIFLNQIHEQHEYIDYFKDYKKEYNYLIKAQEPRPEGEINGVTPSFTLVKNYEELIAKRNKTTICGVVTAEGMHALGKYKKATLFKGSSIDTISEKDRTDLMDSFISNLAEIKDPAVTKFPPFFLTFSHHFNNLLSGQAESFAGLFKLVFNQSLGTDKGLTEFGRRLICDLLSRENGPRILIDTKHMSTEVRKQYYELVKKLKTENINEKIPIIVSHTAVNGIDTLDNAAKHGNRNKIERRSYVSKFDINITDEDIKAVFLSDGIIGVLMHDGRMPGGRFREKLKSAKNYPELKKRLYSQMFLTNIFHIVKVNREYIKVLNANGAKYSELDAWRTLSLGSDNDGIVDPYDTFETAADLPDFKLKLIEAMKTQERPYMKDYKILSLPSEKPFTPIELEGLMMGQTPEIIVDRIFFDNVDTFLSKYFTNAYLNDEELIA